MRKKAEYPAGQVHTLWLESALLKESLLGEGTGRRIDVYLPHGHTGAALPLLVDLAGFLSGGPAHSNWRNFGENLPERLDRLIAEDLMPAAVVAMPDCFTRLGGNQYINSTVLGPWADILIREMVPLVEQQFACGGVGRRALFGKSSGGYGALVHALLHADFWSAAASHSGDIGFELMFGPEFPVVLRALATQGNSAENWLRNFEAKTKQKGDDLHVLMLLAMCASFDPAPELPFGIRLPVDLHTCERLPERWQNWLQWDPLSIAAQRAAELKKLKLLYFDCGTVDQYNLLYGSRRLHSLLEQRGIAHVYEEFPDNHSSIDYRLDRSLPLLATALG
jgi:enterochelin esterase-like enzyme